MSLLDQALLAPAALGLFLVGVVCTLVMLRAIRRRRSRRRAVERPNSHYSSQLARDTVARHRWHDMPLDRVHEINREEVVRLLAKVEATSAQALTAKERAFLEYMAELAGPPSRPTKPPHSGSSARHPLEPQLGTG